MKKMVRFIKKSIAIILAFAICAQTFAAVVADNDGSAFISKAEFDSLKNDFQSQLDAYNTSIDNKIDSAIASYIAGINVTKQDVITSLLDSNGMYGQYYTYWSSATDKAFDTKSSKPGVMDVTMSTYEWDWSTNTSYGWNNHTGWSWSYYLKSVANNCWNLAESDYKFTTSKKVKFKESDGTETLCYQRAKQWTAIDVYGEQITEYWNAPSQNPWGPSALYSGLTNTANLNQFVQGATNIWIEFYNNGATTKTWSPNDYKYSWMLGGSVSMKETDETDTLTTNTVYPLSTQNDYYWDPDIKNEHIVWTGGTGLPAAKSTTKDNAHIYGNTFVKDAGVSGHSITPQVPKGFTIPWLEKYTTSNEMILYDWKLVHRKNNKIKNGLVLCEFTKDYDKVKTKLKADKAGTVYLYCNSAPTNSWGETQVVSKAIPANTVTEVEWEGDIKSGYLLWMRYLPTDTTVTSIVSVESIIAEAEQK